MAQPGTLLDPPAKTPSRSGLRAGRYELLTRLAAGGMGEVFIARQTSEGAFEKRVALKLLLPHLSHDEEFVHMFLDEARIAARMNHPNIVQIFDLGVAEGRYFIAMGLVEGTSLSRLLSACRARSTQLPLPMVRLIAGGLCAGLSYAHELKGASGEGLGIIHRDVNPSNLMVSTAGALLLTDFGIAKAQDNLHRTRPGDVKGKYAYMAPEQMKVGGRLDLRLDVFAAGVTLFETATLISPFARGTDAETLDAVRRDALPDPRSLRADLPPGVAHALVAATAKDPDQRLGSARELRDLMLDGPVAAPHELGEWVQRMCSAELAVFRGVPSAPIQELGTRSLVGEHRSGSVILRTPTPVGGPEAELTHTPTRPRRHLSRRAALAFGFLIGVAVVSGVVGLRVALMAGRPHPAPVDPPSAALPPGPPLAAALPVKVPPAEPVSEPVAAPEPERAPEPVVAPARVSRRREAKRNKTPEPAPAAQPAVPEPPRVGYLSVDAKPWASLYIEGHEVDRTPLSRFPLPVGEHLLIFKNPELGKEVKRKVTIEEGKVATLRVDFVE